MVGWERVCSSIGGCISRAIGNEDSAVHFPRLLRVHSVELYRIRLAVVVTIMLYVIFYSVLFIKGFADLKSIQIGPVNLFSFDWLGGVGTDRLTKYVSEMKDQPYCAPKTTDEITDYRMYAQCNREWFPSISEDIESSCHLMVGQNENAEVCMMHAFGPNHTYCTPYNNEVYGEGNTIFITTVEWLFPFRCAEAQDFPNPEVGKTLSVQAEQGNMPQCVKLYNCSRAHTVYVHGVEDVVLSAQFTANDGRNQESQMNNYFETVDFSGNVYNSLSWTAPQDKLKALEYLTLAPTLGQVLELAGVSLEDWNPTAPGDGHLANSAYRLTGMNIGCGMEYFNLQMPNQPYHGNLATWWKILWSYNTESTNWKLVKRYFAQDEQWSMRKQETVWADDYQSGIDKVASGVKITYFASGQVSRFNFGVLVTTLVSAAVLLKIADSIAEKAAVRYYKNFESTRSVVVKKSETGTLVPVGKEGCSAWEENGECAVVPVGKEESSAWDKDGECDVVLPSWSLDGKNGDTAHEGKEPSKSPKEKKHHRRHHHGTARHEHGGKPRRHPNGDAEYFEDRQEAHAVISI